MGNFSQKIELVSSITKLKKVTFFEQILTVLDGKMACPDAYGWYHLLCLFIVLSLCTLVFLKAKGISEKRFNLCLGVTAGVLMLLEIYKQLNYSYDPSNDAWGYEWYAFPFQFCSTPMYVMFVTAFLKEGKVKRSLCAFLATYGLFAGVAVMLYPNDVFIKTIGINIQTMAHHGMMVVIGTFMYVSGRAELSPKTILRAVPTFSVLIAMALTMNLLYGAFGDPEQTFNMFYISPYYVCTLPVLSAIYGEVPYLVFLLIYLIGFTIAGGAMTFIALGLSKLKLSNTKKKKTTIYKE